MNIQRLISRTPSPLRPTEDGTHAAKKERDANLPRQPDKSAAQWWLRGLATGLAVLATMQKSVRCQPPTMAAPPPPAYDSSMLWCSPYNADSVKQSAVTLSSATCRGFPDAWQQNTSLIGQPQSLSQVLGQVDPACTTQSMAFVCGTTEGVLLADDAFCNAVDVLNTFCSPMSVYLPSLVSGKASELSARFPSDFWQKQFSMIAASKNITVRGSYSDQAESVEAAYPMGLYVTDRADQVSENFWSVIKEGALGGFRWTSQCDQGYEGNDQSDKDATSQMRICENLRPSPLNPPSPPPSFSPPDSSTAQVMNAKQLWGLGFGVSTGLFGMYVGFHRLLVAVANEARVP